MAGSPSLRRAVLAVFLLGTVSWRALAGPNGGAVVGGSATIQGQGTSAVTINQSSQNAIINWQTFNLARGDTATFNQPNSAAVVLNRVIGGQGPSYLDGTLTANGHVFIVNGDGILFGPHSSINTAGFLATTSNITNSDFMAGRYNFNIPGLPNASIVNQGSITASSGGFAALVAPGVRNSGTITATLGTVALAAGNAYTLDLYGDNLITLAVNDQIASAVKDVQTGQTLRSLVSNTGLLSANGGRVQLTATAARAVVDSVINNKGIVEANSIGNHNGMIVLSAATGSKKPAGAPVQTVKVGGVISAAGKTKGTKGGTVVVSGENIQLAGATIDASGDAGGGHVLIGGDTGGGSPSVAAAALTKLESFVVPTASTVTVDAASTINASATGKGNGGKVVLWSNEQTAFAGTILAQGGAQGGDGGFVETSSHGTVNFSGAQVNTSAPNGVTGTWLVDPTDLVIDSTAAATLSTDLATTSVVLQTFASGAPHGPAGTLGNTNSAGLGDIDVEAAITWTSASTLTLNAYHDININADIAATRGGLTLSAGGSINPTAAVNVGTFILQKGAWTQVSAILPEFSANDFRFEGGTFLRALGGTGSSAAPYQITDVYGLQGIRSASLLQDDFVLANNIDASGTANWNGGAGFRPISVFAGALDGQDNSINLLTIHSSGIFVGLFGESKGTIRNLGLTNVDITSDWASANGSAAHIGGLAAINEGTISNSFVTGTISSNSTSATAPHFGGLVGSNFGVINQSYTNVVLTDASAGTNLQLGGLAGVNGGTISQSYAAGTVTALGNSPSGTIGGLVGLSTGKVELSYATAAVSGGDNAEVGGLIGTNNGLVSQTYATGAVSGAAGLTGGLVGDNGKSGVITTSYWDIQTTDQTHSSGSADSFGLTTAQFLNPNSFAGWQFGTQGGNCGNGGSCWVIVDSNGTLNGTDGATRPFLLSEYSTTISNSHQLQLVALDPTASYTLAGNISLGSDLKNASSMWGGAATGFVPIASLGGSFDGQGYTIDGLTIAPTDASVGSIGLFAVNSGSISNLNLTNVSIAANAGFTGPGQWMGSLAGQNTGTITNVTVSGGSVNGGAVTNLIAGGLVGQNNATITLSSAGVKVTVGDGTSDGLNLVGGLAGANLGAITYSTAGGDVGGGLYSLAGGLVGANDAAIANSSASGNVTVAGVSADSLTSSSSLNPSFGGGLVGQNGNGGSPAPTATIVASFAIGNVTGTGVNIGLGGLVGNNAAGSTITDSQAIGNVTAKTDAVANSFVNAGGLVGLNQGTVNGTTTPSVPSSNSVGTVGLASAITEKSGCSTGVAFSCASGDVSVGALGQGGGLVGNNDGTLTNVLATGNVTATGSLASDPGTGDNQTRLGGLAGVNTGSIATVTGTVAYASGNVGTTTLGNVTVGGLVGENHGTIGNAGVSSGPSAGAYGSVSAGDNSTAGGLTGSNSASNDTCTTNCGFGDGHNNAGVVTASTATGNVTVGDASFGGGLSGNADGSFLNSSATGNVTGGANSVLGGLVGAMGALDGPSLVSLSTASGTVTSTGSNSTVGGLVGVNGGTIDQSHAIGAVNGASQSYLGGLVGINIGTIHESTATGAVTGSGTQNVTGGVAGENIGLIDPTSSSGNVSSGTDSFVGGLVGANVAFSNFTAGQLPLSSFPIGTISSDSIATGTASGGTGSQVGAQVGFQYPTSGLPSYSSILVSCGNAVCTILGGPPAPVLFNPTPAPPPVQTTETQLIQNLVQSVTPPTTTGDVVTVNTQTPPPHPGSGPGAAPPQGPGSVPPQFGSRFFTPPPVDPVNYVHDEVVLQIPSNIPLSQLQTILNQLGLSILGSQPISLLGVTSYRLHISDGQSVATIIQKLATYSIIAGAQSNNVFFATQQPPQEPTPASANDPSLASLSQGEGDAAQYALGKLGLISIHRQLKGDNVGVAVIDSQIDTRHPDLDGVVADQFDAVGNGDKPHAHGTGMAGAIFAHRRLMGVAPSARLYAVHAFATGAASAESTTFNILKGLEWAASKSVRVINMSFAGPRDPSLERELKAAHDKGIVLIAAAGNAGPKSPPLYPGADPNVIAVTATDADDKVFAGANRGKYIAVAAPGVDILVPAPDNTYQVTTGTSVASAEVSGLAALIIERNPELGPEDVRKILTSSAHRLGNADDFGSGLVDPSRAIETAGDFKTLNITATVPPRSGPSAPGSTPSGATSPGRPPVVNVNHPGGTPTHLSH